MCNSNNCKKLLYSIIDLSNIYRNCCLKQIDITKNENIEEYIRKIITKIKNEFKKKYKIKKIIEETENNKTIIYILQIIYRNIKYTVILAIANNKIYYDTYITSKNNEVRELEKLKQELDDYIEKVIKDNLTNINKINIKKIIDKFLKGIENKEQQNNNQDPF